MKDALSGALAAGVERLSAWADLLDQINVFPVADGDTGRNLVVSLAPLRDSAATGLDREGLIQRLLLSARGNAGNIAARFFSGFLLVATDANPEALAAGVREGRSLAWQAVADPKPGTMLTLFDALEESVWKFPPEYEKSRTDAVIKHLAEAVQSTPRFLPRLRDAGVLDAGALGMYLFFEGFFSVIDGRDDDEPFLPLSQVFPEGLQLRSDFSSSATATSGYCVDVTLRTANRPPEIISRLSAAGESVVVHADREYLKIHLHAPDPAAIRKEMNRFGDVVSWKEDNLAEQSMTFLDSTPHVLAPIHIMTDAAGSLTRSQARQLGITLLDSYVTLGDRSLPETRIDPTEVYGAMRQGSRVITSQASLFERHQIYTQVLERHRRVLYLCVGSAYTGNVATVRKWKALHDREDRLVVLDTGAASGRLGLLALIVARFSQGAENGEQVIAFARRLLDRCEEYLFLDRLQYLADGGRLSRTGAVLGDLLSVRLVISPRPEGAKKVASLRNRKEQLSFALKKLSGIMPLPAGTRLTIMLEHSDNQDWVETEVREAVTRHVCEAEVFSQPLSLTTGVHTGPDTWGIAFLAIPEEMKRVAAGCAACLRETGGEGKGREE